MIAGSEGLDRRVSCNMKCCCGGTDYTQMVNDDLKMIYYKIPRCDEYVGGILSIEVWLREDQACSESDALDISTSRS